VRIDRDVEHVRAGRPEWTCLVGHYVRDHTTRIPCSRARNSHIPILRWSSPVLPMFADREPLSDVNN